jgi:2-polyprenyl-3-methyl-5-hydroxy-6-metoxy-1,4-benzoquinol methylase
LDGVTRAYCQCENPTVTPLFPVTAEGGGVYELHRCDACGLVWDAPMPGEAELARAYSQAYYSSTEAKFNPLIEGWTRYSGRKRAQALLRRHGRDTSGIRVLDVGCGRGVLLQGFREEGADALGIERGGSGFEEIEGIEALSLDDLLASGRTFDVIVIWHVLEHLPDPQESLVKCRQLLASGGSLFVEVPNFGSLQAKLFGARWFHLDLPRHLFHFTPATLAAALRKAVFSVKSKATFSIDQNLYGFLQSALNCLPFLPANHLYGLLRSKLSIVTLLAILLYTPFAALIAIPALLDTFLASAAGRGAVITMHASPEPGVRA